MQNHKIKCLQELLHKKTGERKELLHPPQITQFCRNSTIRIHGVLRCTGEELLAII